jgi:hypothetical protein
MVGTILNYFLKRLSEYHTMLILNTAKNKTSLDIFLSYARYRNRFPARLFKQTPVTLLKNGKMGMKIENW